MKWLAALGCFPCISRRGSQWRAHVNATGNYWEEAVTPHLAMERAVAKWEKAGRPMDGYADAANIPLCVNDRRKPPSAAVILGRVVEAGNVACLDGRPGLVIETTEAQLRDFGRNLIGCEVEIGVRADKE
jgi:hypothetical protein